MLLVHWHSSFTLGFFIVLVVSEHGSLPGAIHNTVVSLLIN
jgi:hypothetical protein